MNDGGRAEFLKLDVTEHSDCLNAAEIVHAEHGQLDILVNNAGLGHVGTILGTTADDLDRLYDVNVRGMFDLTKVFIPQMIERKYGVIINMSSVGGIAAVSERIAYCTTKFAVVGLTKCIALDHALDGIRANCICPGRVETPFVKARLAEYPDPEKAYREMAATQAIGRMGKPEEIAAAALLSRQRRSRVRNRKRPWSSRVALRSENRPIHEFRRVVTLASPLRPTD